MRKDEQSLYQEWFEKIKKVSEDARLLHEDKKLEKQEEHQESAIPKKVLLSVFLLALLPRLYFIFIAGSPDDPGVAWYADTFHHWQIGYLTKTVGFAHGFLRLWDFKGLEYFWGALHPWLLSLLFFITGSTSLLVPRLLSIIAGSISVVLIFVLSHRYFNIPTAFAAAALAALNPVGIYSDTSGMQEPLGIVLMLSGIAAWPKHAFLTGFFWAFASMVRGEHWVFTLGLLGSLLVFSKHTERKIIAFIFYTIPIFFYMKYLLSWSGNVIYPIYWNFFANAKGEWQGDLPLVESAVYARMILTVTLIISLFGIGWVLLLRPRYYLLFLLGWGSWLFLSIFVGWTEYLKSYVPRFWIDRIFLLSYMFLGLLISVGLFYWMQQRFKVGKVRTGIGAIIVVVILLASQLLWKPIWYYYTHMPLTSEPTTILWEREIKIADEVKNHYKVGNILIPEDRPIFTYLLVNREGFTGPQIIGQMYDPFYYYKGDAFAKWPTFRKKMFSFLSENNISLIVSYYSDKTYEEMYKREPQVFKKVFDWWINIYEVHLPKQNGNV